MTDSEWFQNEKRKRSMNYFLVLATAYESGVRSQKQGFFNSKLDAAIRQCRVNLTEVAVKNSKKGKGR